MINWKRLFEISKHQYGGHVPSTVVELTPEDQKWIDTQLKQFQFDDQDRLKGVVLQLGEIAATVMQRLEKG